MNGEYEFNAEFVACHVDMSWVEEQGLLAPNRTLAAVAFSVDGERCWGTLKIAVEDDQGYIERVNVEWPDVDGVCMEVLRELLKARALEALTAPLKAARERLGLSQREVGEALGYTGSGAQQIIFRWESGAREPSASHLAAWATALGMKIVAIPSTE